MSAVSPFEVFKLAVLAAAVTISLVVNWWVTKAYFTAASRPQPLVVFLFYLIITLFVTLILPFFSLTYLVVWISRSRPLNTAMMLAVFLLWMAPTLAMMLRNSRRWKNPYR